MTDLETGRLRLRPLTDGDRDALFGIYADPEVSRHLITRPQSIEEFRRPFEQMLELASTLGMWAIVLRDDDRLIGRCGYYPCSEPPVGIPELAYLLSRDYWGLGIATEAARRCLDYAFVDQAWPEVVAMVRLGNAASVRVLRKVGMQLLRRIEVRGNPAELYGLRRTSYPARPASQPNRRVERAVPRSES
jgi:RimJ/RimL family protein N-acetyltransferase